MSFSFASITFCWLCTRSAFRPVTFFTHISDFKINRFFHSIYWFSEWNFQMYNNIFSSQRSLLLSLLTKTEKVFKISENIFESLSLSLLSPHICEIFKTRKITKTSLITIETHVFILFLFISRHPILIINFSFLIIRKSLISLGYFGELFFRFWIRIFIWM